MLGMVLVVRFGSFNNIALLILLDRRGRIGKGRRGHGESIGIKAGIAQIELERTVDSKAFPSFTTDDPSSEGGDIGKVVFG